MEFKQKRMATKTSFKFDDTELHHLVRDNSGEIEFSVSYGAIPAKPRKVFNRNNWLRNVGVIWVVLGLISVGLALVGARGDESSILGSSFWLFIGLGCLAFYRLTWSEYSVYDTEVGSIWVVHDDQHDDIVAAMQERRKERLLAWFHSLEFEGNVENEIDTIEWLEKNGVFSADQARDRIEELRTESETKRLTGPEFTPSSTKIH